MSSQDSTNAIHSFRQFAEAFRLIGHSMYSDEQCGHLLAYAALSGSEDVVTNTALCAAILCAQDQFNIKGGEVPDMGRIPYWQKAMQDLRDLGTRSPWWEEFAARYTIDRKRWPILDAAFKANFVYFEGPMTAKRMGRLREGVDDDTPTAPVGRVAHLRGDDDEPEKVSAHAARTRLRGDDDDGPGEEDGPWADGWNERSGAGQPKPPITNIRE